MRKTTAATSAAAGPCTRRWLAVPVAVAGELGTSTATFRSAMHRRTSAGTRWAMAWVAVVAAAAAAAEEAAEQAARLRPRLKEPNCNRSVGPSYREVGALRKELGANTRHAAKTSPTGRQTTSFAETATRREVRAAPRDARARSAAQTSAVGRRATSFAEAASAAPRKVRPDREATSGRVAAASAGSAARTSATGQRATPCV